MRDKATVVITVRDYETWTKEQRAEVAQWLERKAKELERHEGLFQYAEVVRLRYYAG